MAFHKNVIPSTGFWNSQALRAQEEGEPKAGFMQERGQEGRNCLLPATCPLERGCTQGQSQLGQCGFLSPVITHKWAGAFYPGHHTQL